MTTKQKKKWIENNILKFGGIGNEFSKCNRKKCIYEIS